VFLYSDVLCLGLGGSSNVNCFLTSFLVLLCFHGWASLPYIVRNTGWVCCLLFMLQIVAKFVLYLKIKILYIVYRTASVG
jgi:hypothetical protein